MRKTAKKATHSIKYSFALIVILFSFSRNTRLNYNSQSIYGGAGFMVSKKIGLSLGGSYGLEEAGTWGVSAGLGYSF